MPRPEPTEIRIDESGTESHESWLLIRANNVSSSPGARLFDSEITHAHYIQVSVSRCTRQRDLNRDWIFATQELIEINMSQAQWGAFVSSFGNGNGVPATLSHWQGEMVPGVATVDSRLDQSHKEVRDAASKAVMDVRQAHTAVVAAFDRGAGKKEMRELLRNLDIRMQNLPSNMEFAAKSMTEHVENVVTKARYDIEGMAYQAIRNRAALNDNPTFLELIEGNLGPSCVSEHGVGHDTCPKCWTS